MFEAECDFWDMDEISEEAGQFYKSDLFIEDGADEPFLLFHEVRVATEHRRQGTG